MLLRILRFLVNTFFNSLGQTAQDSIKVYHTLMKIRDTRGQVDACRVAKTARLAVTTYLSGAELSLPVGISLTGDGLPKILPGSLRDRIRASDPTAIKLALTVLSISRAWLGGTPVDYEPITKSFEGTIPNSLLEFIPRFSQESLHNPTVDPSWRGFHYTTKAGPNGPALAASMADLAVLFTRPHLVMAIEVLSEPPRWMFKTLERWNQTPITRVLNEAFGVTSKGLLRRLSIKKDRESKSRVFAIMDYWSQAALYGLHKELYQLLKKLPRDCTFNQGAGLDLVADGDSHYWSVDLSNATDRFPIQLQEALLAHWIGPLKAGA